MAGDRETGICIMQMDEGLDTGGVLSRESVPIGPQTTAGELHDVLAALGARMIVEAVAGRADGAMTAVLQPDTGVTYAAKIDKAETRIDWSRPAVELDRHIRALSPFPGAWTQLGAERIKILAVEIVPDRSGPPGQTLDDALLVGCGTWSLRATLIQREGKRPMPTDEAIRGKTIPRGSQLA
jgi:methionyl-tRNA formyltransferase